MKVLCESTIAKSGETEALERDPLLKAAENESCSCFLRDSLGIERLHGEAKLGAKAPWRNLR